MNIHKSPYSAEEEEGGRRKEEEGERRAPNKAGPMRPPLLNGIKWEWVGGKNGIWTFNGYDKRFILVKGRRRNEE